MKRTGSWIRRFHPALDRPARVVMLPHAGGAATYFFPFSEALAPHADVLSIQYPGRQDRLAEPCIDSVAELADAVFDALLPWLDLPIVLFGHSLGASVAYEVAVRLEHGKGVVPRCLIASGRRAPADTPNRGLHLLDDDAMLEHMATDGGTDPRVLADPDLRAMIVPALRSDYRAAETYTYQPGPPLSCPVLALTGDADPRMTPDHARGWQTYTTGPFDLKIFPGGHFFLTDPRPAIVDLITGRLS